MKVDFLNQSEKSEVIKSLYNFYGVEVSNFEEIPVGEESTSFKVVTKDGKEYFAKHCSKTNVIKHIELANSLLIELSKLNIDFVVPPVVKDHRTSFDVLGGKLYLYPYIKGDVVRMDNDKFPADLVNTLMSMLVQLFKITHSISTKLPVEDYYSDYNKRFYTLLKVSPVYNKAIFLQIFNANKEKIEELIIKYEKLGSTLKSRNIPNVLTHGDVTGLNFINARDKLYLTDWDGAMLAPAERDLNFLVSNPNFSIENYLKETGKPNYRGDVKDYYGIRWALDSILGNLKVLATTKLNENDIKETADEVDEYVSYY